MRYAISARHAGAWPTRPIGRHATERLLVSPRLYEPNCGIRRRAAIAMRHGFSELGRFAGTYRFIFGRHHPPFLASKLNRPLSPNSFVATNDAQESILCGGRRAERPSFAEIA